MPDEPFPARPLQRVLILADDSAGWKVAGLRQIDRLAFSLNEFAESRNRGAIKVDVRWENGSRVPLPNDPRLQFVEIRDTAGDDGYDLVLSTHAFLTRGAIAELFAANLDASQSCKQPWEILKSRSDIPKCERRFLRGRGKSQDGLISRYINRPVSRSISRWLLKLPITPSAWSLFIFVLPILACFAFIQGSYMGFVVGAAIFQLYSILDGCDGEIARAKFMQTEFGRRLDSFCDLIGNVLLALCIGVGLARQHATTSSHEWLFIFEGIVTAILILTSEGIVFVRRTRGETTTASPLRWNGALYQRHHEFVERSGILLLGDEVARWLLLLTKRDMAMFAFFILALVALPALSLHLLLVVSAASTALAGNAFLRQTAPAVAQEAS